MLDLPTIKTDFLFENSQDFNQTTHARPQHPIVFIHNISLYFNCISSVKYLFKWLHKPNAYFERWEKCLRVVPNAVFFLLFSIFKMATCSRYDADSEKSDS